ncbi:MAG: succinate dehydrogenase/fumarate reductase iron-sulfur subunit [Proteobacteria bacterium]|nr:succinate dehydrogenase/fumarate reductase iron-sulfur subunit [Pseudomonadota bacterium]
MKLNLKIWRQKSPSEQGQFKDYVVNNANEDMSFLEMLDFLNMDLVRKGEEAVQFDHDCREGICGSCSLMINGSPHGPETGTATCQLHIRKFKDGDTIVIEPFRAKAFPVLRDLCVDRTAFDRIMAAGGFCSVNTGNAPEANSILIGKEVAENAMDSAACIGCGACVAACKNASAMLFVSAKVSQFALLPQGKPERSRRVRQMVAQMDKEMFGSCSNTGACEAACPKEISLENMARLNREMLRASVTE